MIFSNHSCDPNIGVRGQIVFVTLRDVAAGRAILDAEPGVDLDYLERVDSSTFEVSPDGDLIVVAARVGTTRLLDNLLLTEEAAA